MKIKNVFRKPKKIAVLLGAEFLILQDRISGIVSAAGEGAMNNNCHIVANECSKLSFFVTTMLVMFLILILWTISPVGILFFLASKILFSKESSELKRKIAWVAQGIAFLTWTSLMTVMLIVYLDSISYNILNFRSVILDLAITSGFAFLFIMLAVCAMEKKAIANSKKSEAKKNNKEKKNDDEKRKTNNKRKKKTNDGVKIAGIEIGGGMKEKIRRKIKEDLKEIIDDEIDRRL